MKNLKKRRGFALRLATVLFTLSGMIAFAASSETVNKVLYTARPDVKVNISGTLQREDKFVPVADVESVQSGETLEWRISSTNEGDLAAENYQVVGQIPQGTVFIAGSAQDENGAGVTYSIDGGKEYSAEPMIDVPQADGTIKKVPAPVSMYTHVKFESNSPLVVEGTYEAVYRVRVK